MQLESKPQTYSTAQLRVHFCDQIVSRSPSLSQVSSCSAHIVHTIYSNLAPNKIAIIDDREQ